MAETRWNYCQLLGLSPLKESSYTLDSILKKLEKQETKWANDSRNKQNDTEQRFRAEALVRSVPDIRKVMSDPGSRSLEFRKAETILKGKVQKLKQDCLILTDGTYLVLPGIVDNYKKRLHWDGVTKEDVLKLAGVKEGSPPKSCNPKLSNAFNGLRSVGTFTPTEMLNNLIENPDLDIDLPPLSHGSSFSDLRMNFDICEKRVNSVRPDTLPEQDSYIQCMRSVKILLDNDADLSSLIDYGRCQRALAPVTETIEREYTGIQLSRKYIDELMSVHVDRTIGNELALLILQEFCFKKRIAANFSNVDSIMMRCPECGSMVMSGPNMAYCPVCGKNFKVICPSCGATQRSDSKVCSSCGFDFKEGLRKAETLAMRFSANLREGRINKAEDDLLQLRNVYGAHPNLGTMELQLTKAKSHFESYLEEFNKNYDNQRLYEAKRICEDFVDDYPDALKEDVRLKSRYTEICGKVKNADMLCGKARLETAQERRMQFYVQAIDICPDHPEALGKLKEHPPEGPRDAIGTLVDGKFMLKFEPPADSGGLVYCIYRERNRFPVTGQSTVPLAETPLLKFVDAHLDPGVQYYYSVYAKRWGVLSREGFHVGPVMFLPDVDKVSIEPIPEGLRIMYEKPRGCYRVRLWRYDAKMGEDNSIEILLNNETVYDDIGLLGGHHYVYTFMTEYSSNGRIETSSGVKYSGKTISFPKPVNDLEFTATSDGSFVAKWNSKEKVVLYMSKNRIALPGNQVKMEDINAWMTEIKPLETFSNGIRFNLPEGSVHHIYPIIPMGKIGIRGNERTIANLKPVRDVTKTICNHDCIITLIWPPDAVEVKLIISNSNYKAPTDPTAEIVTVKREVYYQDKMIRIPMGNSTKKYINIFAVYKIGNTARMSKGLGLMAYSEDCKKIKYTMTPTSAGMRIDFTADPDVIRIPQILAVQTDMGIPLRKEDGEVVWKSDDQVSIAGSGSIDARCTGLTDVTKTRLFFQDEEDYNLFRFVHPLYGRGRR